MGDWQPVKAEGGLWHPIGGFKRKKKRQARPPQPRVGLVDLSVIPATISRAEPDWLERAKAGKVIIHPRYRANNDEYLPWGQCAHVGTITHGWTRAYRRCRSAANPLSKLQCCRTHDPTAGADPILGGIRVRRNERKDLEYWAERNRVLRGKAFSLRDYPYLKEIYACKAKRMVIMKAAQMGVTEFALNAMIHFLKFHPGTTGLYILPSQADAKHFSDVRIKGIFTPESGLQEMKSSINNKLLKQVGDSFLFLRGCEAEHQAQSAASEFNVIDEYDYCDPAIVKQFRARLKNAEHGREIIIGYPRASGIRREFDRSDQRHYYVTCPQCRQEFPLCCSFFTAIRVEEDRLMGKTYRFACPSCGVTWNRSTMGGIWKPSAKSEVAGFHLSRMLNLNATAESLWKEQEDYDTRRDFFSLCLGLPWEDKNWQLKDHDFETTIENARYDFRTAASGTFAGLDQGDELYLYIDDEVEHGKRVCVHAEVLTGSDCWDQLAQRVRQYGIRGIVVDAMPNKIDAEKFCRQHRDIAWFCFYQDELKTGRTINWHEDRRQVNVDRFYMFDLAMEEFKRCKILLPRSPRASMIKSHWKNVLRELIESPDGETRAAWRKLGPDHYWHAFCYCTIARLRTTLAGPVLVKRWSEIPEEPERDLDALEIIESDLGSGF